MRVASHKTQLTNEDEDLKKYLDTRTCEEYKQWEMEEVKKYYVGQPVRAVLGAYTGVWMYGTVTKIYQHHIKWKNIDGSTWVKFPSPRGGLEPISQEELEAAKRGDFIQ